MAYQHWRVIDALTTHTSDDTTYRVKLPSSGVLHSIVLRTLCTNGSTSNQGLGMTDAVDSIKVIANGSRVLFSLEPETIKMLHYYNEGTPINESLDESASTEQSAEYVIPFGRNLYDSDFWLPCQQFTDLELQIAYSPTIAATSFATGTFKSQVLGLMTLGGTPGGYAGTLVSRIIENFTSTASGDKTIDMPRNYPWRALFVRAYEAAVADGTNLTNVKLSLNNDEVIPVNLPWASLVAFNQAMRPVVAEQRRTILRTNNDTVATQIARIRAALLANAHAVNITNDTFEVAAIDAISGDTLTLDIATADITAGSEDLTGDTTDRGYYLRVSGDGLPFAVAVPVSPADEPPYFNSRAYDDIDLILTNANAGADCDVVLQEVVNF